MSWSFYTADYDAAKPNPAMIRWQRSAQIFHTAEAAVQAAALWLEVSAINASFPIVRIEKLPDPERDI